MQIKIEIDAISRLFEPQALDLALEILLQRAEDYLGRRLPLTDDARASLRAMADGDGRYLLCSDIPNNRQLRWLEDDERVTVFRSPSNNSNGNTFDFQGRQLSCEHLTRRVVRYGS